MEKNSEGEAGAKESAERENGASLTKVESKKGGPAEELPSNLYSFAGLVIKTLGNQAVPILVVAGLVFAVYIFYKQAGERDKAVEKARLETESIFQDRLSKANEMADKAYVKIAELSRKQIDTVNNLMQMQEEAAKFLERQRVRTEEARKQADEEIKRSMAAKQEAERKISEAKDAISKAEILRENIKALAKKNDEKERQLKKESDNLNKRVDEIQVLKKKYIALAKSVLGLQTTLEEDEELFNTEAYSLSEKARDEYFPEDVDSPATLWLSQFKRNPTTTTSDALEKLVGLRATHLEPILMQGLNYHLWVKIRLVPSGKKDTEGLGEEQQIAYVGIGDVTDLSYDNIITISMGTFTEEGNLLYRVSDVNTTKSLSLIEMRDTNNWYASAFFDIVTEFDNEVSVTRSDFSSRRGIKHWDMLKYFEGIDIGESAIVLERIFGKEVGLKILTYADAQYKFPQLIQIAQDNESIEFTNAVAMEKRSNSYTPPEENRDLIEKLPPELKETFDRLLEAAVADNIKKARSFMELNINQNLLGQIAAIALKPDFHIVRIKPIYTAVPKDDVGDTLQQQSLYGTEQPTGIESSPPIGYDIFIDYNDSFSEKNISAARFEFVTAETITGWILRNWELL